MPTREEYLKWAEETMGFGNYPYPANDYDLEALCNRVWNEAIEAAANDMADQVEVSIRNLKQGETNAKP